MLVRSHLARGTIFHLGDLPEGASARYCGPILKYVQKHGKVVSLSILMNNMAKK